MITYTYEIPTEYNAEIVVTITDTEANTSCTANIISVWTEGYVRASAEESSNTADPVFDKEMTDKRAAAKSLEYSILQELKP